jgi:hypothetical protein
MLDAPEVGPSATRIAGIDPDLDLSLDAVVEPRRTLWQRLTSPGGLLLVACLGHLVVSLSFVVTHHMWWQQDEVVYLSQVGAHTPALKFTPPRARGLPVLLYPLVHFTTDVTAVRTYISVLGTAFLYFGLRPWLRLGHLRSVAGAALLFSLLWASGFFGALVQPNFIVATLAVGAVGYFVLALRAVRTHRYLVATAGWLALMALVRPSDATWVAGALLAALLVIRSVSWGRRRVVGAAVLGGLILGWSEWVIEAQVAYHGFFSRLHTANKMNTPGIHFSLLTEARDINGPVLCRPCSGVPVSASHIAWWFAIPPLVAIGLYGARHTRRFLPLALATVCGLAVLAEYVFTVDYAAPRFLLPTYLLLALPCAAGVGTLIRWRPDPDSKARMVTAIALVLAIQAVTQADALTQSVNQATANRARFLTAANRLRAAGVQAPCIVYGRYGPPVAFALGCDDHPQGTEAFARIPTGTTVVVLTSAREPAYQSWASVRLKRHSGWTAYIR